MNLSYWEIKSWLNNIDYTIVGSGIVGLNCALRLKEKFPKSKILILEIISFNNQISFICNCNFMNTSWIKID